MSPDSAGGLPAGGTRADDHDGLRTDGAADGFAPFLRPGTLLRGLPAQAPSGAAEGRSKGAGGSVSAMVPWTAVRVMNT